jgi:hypothetical protein
MHILAEIWYRLEKYSALTDFSNMIGEKSPTFLQRLLLKISNMTPLRPT